MKLFLIKYSKSDKRTLIIYFNGLLPSPLERSLGDNHSTWLAECEEPLKCEKLGYKSYLIFEVCDRMKTLKVHRKANAANIVHCHPKSPHMLSKNLKCSISSSHNFKSNNLNLNFVHKMEGTLNFTNTLYDLHLP